MTIAIILTAILLLVGWALRNRIGLFRWLFIPTSVIAGFLGLLLVQITTSGADTEAGVGVKELIETAATNWRSWPALLIAVVFAGMLLERQPASLRSSLRRAGREGLMVWIIILGETMVGLFATWLLIGPRYQVPDAFGMLIETGFAGGHGTAAAMGQVFASEAVGLDSGLDLGVMMATVGLVYGIISGVLWINIGVRRGWTHEHAELAASAESASDGSKPANTDDGREESVDPILMQAIWLALAVGTGMVFQWIVGSAVAMFDSPALRAPTDTMDALRQRTQFSTISDSFPLFIYTLFGGLVVRQLLTRLGRSDWIDPGMIGRLTAIAMDVLVVAAIASLNLTAVTERAGSLLILIVAAAAWTAICLLVLSRHILPRDHWFELGLINYGMSTGTTATGFVLLRMVDPNLESGAAEDYALAAPISSPFIGGGLVTIGLPLIVLGQVPLGIVCISLMSLVAALIAVGCLIARSS